MKTYLGVHKYNVSSSLSRLRTVRGGWPVVYYSIMEGFFCRIIHLSLLSATVNSACSLSKCVLMILASTPGLNEHLPAHAGKYWTATQ